MNYMTPSHAPIFASNLRPPNKKLDVKMVNLKDILWVGPSLPGCQCQMKVYMDPRNPLLKNIIILVVTDILGRGTTQDIKPES